MSLELRSERPGDEEAIDLVTCRAFESMDEANIVRLLREHYPGFDPRYSVMAWDAGDLVGHALFTPAPVRLMGRTVRALAVAPLSVLPERQRQGIGGRLLEFGRRLGRRDGFELAFLAGHPEYYPRHGYTACFGFAKVTIDTDALPQPERTFHRRPVRPDDLEWLVAQHAAEWADVDFAWLWGEHLGEWRLPCINSTLWWTEDGRRAAYTMSKPGRGACAMLLADDPAVARDVIATVRPASLEHHPAGWLVRHALDGVAWATAEVEASEAAMALELHPGALGAYTDAVASGQRLPGASRWPLAFVPAI